MVAHNEWGAAGGLNLMSTIPLFSGCRQWSSAGPSETTTNKVRCWMYLQYTTGYAVSFDGTIGDSVIKGSWTSSGSTHWSTASWDSADETLSRPIGDSWPGTSSSIPIGSVKISWSGA